MPKKIKKLPKLVEKKPKKNRKSVFGAIIVLVIILISAVVLLLFQLEIVTNPFKNMNAQPQLFIIEDECSLIVAQLIHNIKDEDSCQQICKSSCGVRKLTFHNSEFKEIPDNCNLCNCYCK